MSGIELVGTTQLKLRNGGTFKSKFGFEFVAVTPRMALEWAREQIPIEERRLDALRDDSGGAFDYNDLFDVLIDDLTEAP